MYDHGLANLLNPDISFQKWPSLQTSAYIKDNLNPFPARIKPLEYVNKYYARKSQCYHNYGRSI